MTISNTANITTLPPLPSVKSDHTSFLFYSTLYPPPPFSPRQYPPLEKFTKLFVLWVCYELNKNIIFDYLSICTQFFIITCFVLFNPFNSPSYQCKASAKLPLWMSIAVFGAVGTLYTAIGGIKSVIWTDTFQTVVVFVGVFVIIVKGICFLCLLHASLKRGHLL